MQNDEKNQYRKGNCVATLRQNTDTNDLTVNREKSELQVTYLS